MSDFALHECCDCEHYCRECNDCCKHGVDHQDCMFKCWNPSRAYKAEKRCQQLEQTARDMYGSMVVSFSRKKPIRMEQMHEAIIELDALGVIVDD